MKHARDAILRGEQAEYLERLEPARDPVLAKMEAYAEANRCPISDPEVASFLAVTARVARPELVVEVGTNIGYGAIVLARAAGPDARVVTIEHSADLCSLARGFIDEAALADRVSVVQGDALEELAKIAGPIDFVYVDCVKEHYPRYLDLVLPKLSVGGVVVADNVLWKGLTASSEVPDGERARVDALRAFNRTITQSPSLRGVVLPLGDGVAYATKL